jgi:hypothetical protein
MKIYGYAWKVVSFLADHMVNVLDGIFACAKKANLEEMIMRLRRSLVQVDRG